MSNENPSTEVAKWADQSMFTAEKSHAADGPVAYLLGGPSDPLGQIVACINMYKGVVVRDLADVTEAMRRDALEQMSRTVLKMPLEAVSLHFMLEGVHRGITHQMVRQRTAAYAQESTRFAVKEDLADATALPPYLDGTLSLREVAEGVRVDYSERGLQEPYSMDEWDGWEQLARQIKSPLQQARFKWDDAVAVVGSAYMDLVNSGMPAEDARGLMPTNITTRLNYITNLRSFYDTMAVRVSDQAQFEWRMVARAYALAMKDYGKTQHYWTTISREEYDTWDSRHPSNPIRERYFVGGTGDSDLIRIRLSSAWQYDALVEHIRPIEFVKGGPAFDANFDRPSRIGERVAAFAKRGVPSSQWTEGSVEHGIPPISPAEWLLDPNAARLPSGMEFDVFGNRVPKGTGWHWHDGAMHKGDLNANDHYEAQRFWPRDFEEEK
jgi:thymidylate synthase ThyX